MKDKIIIATKQDRFTDAINSKQWTVEHMNFFEHQKEHLEKMKDQCEAGRPCRNTDLHYCEACDLTLCGKHYR